jgi:hypothetical protein
MAKSPPPEQDEQESSSRTALGEALRGVTDEIGLTTPEKSANRPL